jgi:hypothetical protein
VGSFEGVFVGARDASVGGGVEWKVGDAVGDVVGASVGEPVGNLVGAGVGAGAMTVGI